MRNRIAFIATTAAVLLLGCGGDRGAVEPTPPTPTTPPVPPPAPAVLLKEIVIPNLPSPYYHFDYDPSGRVSSASFASGFTIYDVAYDGNKIASLTNITLGNSDRLDYGYDGAGRVTSVKYVKSDGTTSVSITLSYDGAKLTGLERSRRLGSSFLVDKRMSFTYYADGNVQEITEQHPAIDGFQPGSTFVDRYEQYDDKINVDAFGLLHTEFFDHLVLLPTVQLQKGNPARVIHTGDGINYREEYTYTYDDSRRPLAKAGVLTYTNGAEVGRQFPTLSTFTYY